jgi:hypothetical protein
VRWQQIAISAWFLLNAAAMHSESALAAALGALIEKYAELDALCREREAAMAAGLARLTGEAGARRRQRGRALAARFPGALRELEHLDRVAVAARLADLQAERAEAWLRPRRQVARRLWVRLVLEYHEALRDGLRIRRWLKTHGATGATLGGLVLAFRTWYEPPATLRHRPVAPDAAWLRRYLRPPHGRLSELVMGELAARHGMSRAAVRGLIFASPPAGGTAPEDPCVR